MKEFLVYLAGPIAGTSFGECTDWRNSVIKQLPSNITGLSPMRGRTELTHEKTITRTYEDQPLGSGKGITARDRNDVIRADLVLVNFLGATQVSIGTVIEIAWADLLRKPIVVAMEKGNPHEHAILKDIVPFYTTSLEEAVNVAIAILNPIP